MKLLTGGKSEVLLLTNINDFTLKKGKMISKESLNSSLLNPIKSDKYNNIFWYYRGIYEICNFKQTGDLCFVSDSNAIILNVHESSLNIEVGMSSNRCWALIDGKNITDEPITIACTYNDHNFLSIIKITYKPVKTKMLDVQIYDKSVIQLERIV